MSGRPGLRFLGRFALLAGSALLAAAPVMAHDAETDRRVRQLTALHQQMMLGGAGRKIDGMRKRIERGNPPRRGLRSQPPRDHLESLGPQGGSGRASGTRSASGLQPFNLRLAPNSQSFTTQSEVSVAGDGSTLLAAWNDAGNTGGMLNGLGFSTSTDGGRTWVEGGPLPTGGGVAAWTSDPVVTFDAKRGLFYVAGLVITDRPANGVGAIRGHFGLSGFSWGTPSVVRGVRDSFPDKPWMVADSLTGNLYISYTNFFHRQGKNSDYIEFQRSEDGGQTWTPAVKLSPDAEDGLVQGSRPAPGPDGALHVVWKTIDTTAAAGGLDAMRMRSSADEGVSFGPTVTVANLYTNFCSGPPGFDRGNGLGFPSIAVDRGNGPHRGRIHVAWEESLDFYDDRVATADVRSEVEPNDQPRDATPFTIGESLMGRIDPAFDTDWFRFHGDQGQTVLVYLDSLDTRLDVALRLWCGDAQTRLAYSTSVNVRQRILLFTLTATGDYYVTVAPLNDSTGAYRLSTGWARRGAERGRDQRDIFVAHSDDGVHWSTPALACDDPPGFDDWLPELAVDVDGKPYVAWYDWREGDPAACGAASNIRLARSDDGGDHWTPVGLVTETPTLWSAVYSNLTPNMGDYIGLLADEQGVYPAWADGRNADPDVYASFWPYPRSARAIVPQGSTPLSTGLVLSWLAPPHVPMRATVYRRASWEPEVAIGDLETDSAGALSILDVGLSAGFRYHYELGVPSTEGEMRVGAQSVDVPDSLPGRLAIERLSPNPSDGVFRVSFRRPDLRPARVEVLDVGGRRVLGLDLGQEYGARGIVELPRSPRLEPGLYVVRLVQSGSAASVKAVVIR